MPSPLCLPGLKAEVSREILMISRRALLTCAAWPTASFGVEIPSPLPPLSTRYIGLSLPLTGDQAEVGADLELGYRLALRGSESSLRLRVVDDAGDVKRTVQNVSSFAADQTVIAVSGLAGLQNTQEALPVARAANLPVVGIRSGVGSLRDGKPGVVHLRGTFDEELDTIAKACGGLSVGEVVIIHSADSFGVGSRAHLGEALTKLGITVASPIAVSGGVAESTKAAASAAKIIAASGKYTAIVVLLPARPVVDISNQLRATHKIYNPMFAMSFVATRSVATDTSSKLLGLSIVTAFPPPQSSMLAMSKHFRDDCAKFAASEFVDSLTVFEGWFYGSVIARSLAVSRDALLKKINAGVSVYDVTIKPDSQMVAYRHTDIVYKSQNGKLKK